MRAESTDSRRRGRPPVPICARRRHRVNVMLTARDHALLARLARAEGLPVATVAARIVAAALRRRS